MIRQASNVNTINILQTKSLFRENMGVFSIDDSRSHYTCVCLIGKGSQLAVLHRFYLASVCHVVKSTAWKCFSPTLVQQTEKNDKEANN